MHDSRTVHARRLTAGLLAAGIVGLAATGCTSATPSTAPSGSSSTTPGSTSSGSAVPSTSHAAPAKAPKFANATLTVELTGYDAAVHMIEFRKVIRHTSEQIQDHFEVDPADSAAYRLPTAAGVAVDGIGGGGSAICGAAQGDVAHCTLNELITALHQGNPLPAQLIVNGAEQITHVNEQLGVIV
ncbi:MAG: hypothetical protein JOZ47_07060 [Kutzneria sp.]|nr:hypothetical protein [Kutzneria sp.]